MKKMKMINEKLEIPLHDRSVVVVSKTESGSVYLEIYGPGNLRDGHGMLLRGSSLLSDAHINGLVSLLASPAEREAA